MVSNATERRTVLIYLGRPDDFDRRAAKSMQDQGATTKSIELSDETRTHPTLMPGGPDHLGPLLRLIRNELAKVGGRALKYCGTEDGKP